MPADKAGCAFYRHEGPARVAAEHGVEAVICRDDFTIYQAPFGKIVAETQPEGDGTRITEWAEDVVVLQRPAKESVVEIIPILQSRGVAVVVDVDDDFSCLDPRHPAFGHFSPTLSPEVNWHHLRRACGLADLVTVTTPALAERYGGHGRVVVLPNCVPAGLLEMPRDSDGHTLGWAGRAQMHPGDLQATCGGVPEALERTGWRFHNVGPAEGVREGLGLSEEPSSTGGLSVEEYHKALGSLDVGIVPLVDSAFNAAKSGLKGLELGARGIPFVASSTPEYQALADEGIGVVVPERARNWRRELEQLMSDESLRWEAVDRARTAIAERHTLEGESWRWVEAWQSALDRRQQVGLAA